MNDVPEEYLSGEKPWEEWWQQGEMTKDELANGVEWIRSRPDTVKELMKKFPPASLVISSPGVTLEIPSPGKIAIVTGYSDTKEDASEGLIGVRDHPSSDIIASCKPEWITVIGYYKGLTEEKVKEVILD